MNTNLSVLSRTPVKKPLSSSFSSVTTVTKNKPFHTLQIGYLTSRDCVREQSRGTNVTHSSFVSACEESPQMALFTKRCNRSFVFMVRHFRVWDGVTAVGKERKPCCFGKILHWYGFETFMYWIWTNTHTGVIYCVIGRSSCSSDSDGRQKLSVSRRLELNKDCIFM